MDAVACVQTSGNTRRLHAADAGNRCCQHKQDIVFQELSGDSQSQNLLMDNCVVLKQSFYTAIFKTKDGQWEEWESRGNGESLK